jgi:hypothetical protein
VERFPVRTDSAALSETRAPERTRWAHLVVATALTYVVVAVALVRLVHVNDVLGLGTALDAVDLDEPLWIHIFREGGPTELLQWLALAATALLAAFLAGRVSAASNHPGTRRTLVLFGIGCTLLLLEDAGNPRHTVASYADSLTPIPYVAVEMLLYGGLTTVMLLALWRYLVQPVRPPWSTRYLLAAFTFYAMGGWFSATRGFWYDRGGELLHRTAFASGLPEPTMDGTLEFWLMDLLVEESLELLGAACLLAALTTLATELLPRSGVGTGSPVVRSDPVGTSAPR